MLLFAVKSIREWRQNKLKIFESRVKPKNKILGGGGKKPLDLQLENQLNEWIYDKKSDRLRVSKKVIVTKAKYFLESECDESEKSLLWRAMGGSTVSCIVKVFRYVVKQQQHNKILNG